MVFIPYTVRGGNFFCLRREISGLALHNVSSTIHARAAKARWETQGAHATNPSLHLSPFSEM